MKKIFPCLLALTLALTLVLSGCGQDSYTTTLSTDKVADKLLEVLSGRYHGADADYISESRFGANYRDLTEKCYDHIILLSDDEETNIDQIGVFHVINKSDVSGVADAVTSFVEAQHIHTFHRLIHNMLYLASKHFLRIAIGIQQTVECHPHGLVGGHVRDVPVFIVEAGHEDDRQTDRFRHIRDVAFLIRLRFKLYPAVILGGGLRLLDQAFDVVVLLIVLDAQMGFDLIDGDDHQ